MIKIGKKVYFEDKNVSILLAPFIYQLLSTLAECSGEFIQKLEDKVKTLRTLQIIIFSERFELEI